MFPSINSVRKLRIERSEDFEPASSPPEPSPGSIVNVLKALGSSIEAERQAQPMRDTELDYSTLIDRIRASASRVREVEAQARERDAQVEDILERARADMRSAEERMRKAEMQASQIEAAAAERIRAAEVRAAAAEERARACEIWLARIQDVIFSEFGISEELVR